MGLITRLVRHSHKSREQIVEAMSELFGERVSIHAFNAACAPSKGGRFPAQWVWPLCQVLGDDSPALLVMGPRLAAEVQLGKALVELSEIDPRAVRLVERLHRNGRKRRGRARR